MRETLTFKRFAWSNAASAPNPASLAASAARCNARSAASCSTRHASERFVMRRTAASSSAAACTSSCRASRSIAANIGLSPRKQAHRSDRRAVRSARISASSLNAAFFVIPENGDSAQSARSARSQRSTSVEAISPYPSICETPSACPSSRKRRSEQMALPNAVSAKRRRPRRAATWPWRTSAGATRPNSTAGSFAATTTAAACAPAMRPMTE